MTTYRNAVASDCKIGAVLIRDGVLYDVLEDWKMGGCVKLRADGSSEVEHVQQIRVGKYKLVRKAPRLKVPVLTDAQDARRRERLDFSGLEHA